MRLLTNPTNNPMRAPIRPKALTNPAVYVLSFAPYEEAPGKAKAHGEVIEYIHQIHTHIMYAVTVRHQGMPQSWYMYTYQNVQRTAPLKSYLLRGISYEVRTLKAPFDGCNKVRPVLVCCEIARNSNAAITALLMSVEIPAPMTPNSGKKGNTID